MIDGAGDPNTSRSFQDAVEALYAVSYSLKFTVKKGLLQLDYGVLPLEGLWWSEDMTTFTADDKSDWKWTLMIMQPPVVTASMATGAIESVRVKKDLPALPLMRFESFTEGFSIQTLHIGPFSEEGPVIEELHRQIEKQGKKRRGKHHEIYLSDIRRAAPEKWRTVIRQPAG
jgi:hypothetical protein